MLLCEFCYRQHTESLLDPKSYFISLDQEPGPTIIRSTTSMSTKRFKIFYRWWIILIAAIGLSVGYGRMIVYTLGGVVGPLLMGLSFDFSGSYRFMLILFLVAIICSASLLMRLGPYRRWEAAEAIAS